MDKFKWAAVVEYDSGETAGAVVEASSEMEAWRKVLEAFNCGKNVRSVRLAMIVTSERECL